MDFFTQQEKARKKTGLLVFLFFSAVVLIIAALYGSITAILLWNRSISNPFQPKEVAWMVPYQGEWRGTESVLIEWDRKLIHVFADSGLYILSSPVLGDPILGPLKPKSWTPRGLNAGAP